MKRNDSVIKRTTWVKIKKRNKMDILTSISQVDFSFSLYIYACI